MFSSKMIGFAGRCRSSVLLAVSLLAVPACFAQFTAPAPTSNAEIAWFTMGRMGVNPVNGNVLPYGFFTIINGLPFPIFTGLPNESTALFTFRYTVSQVLPLTSNIDQNIFIGGPAIVDIYLNPNAKRDWNDPSTFATGQKIATYIRGAYQSEQIFVTQYQMSSAKLISSTPVQLRRPEFRLRQTGALPHNWGLCGSDSRWQFRNAIPPCLRDQFLWSGEQCRYARALKRYDFRRRRTPQRDRRQP